VENSPRVTLGLSSLHFVKKAQNSMYMENTAKNFALQLGSLVSLYVSIAALITLLFGVVTIQFPDVANGYWEQESARSAIRTAIALLVVFFPTYIVLTRIVNTIRRREQGVYLTLTKWLIYISLLVGGIIILGDLVMIINAFLNGELTVRFFLKALVFLVVIGSAFAYYFFDARGYWQNHEKESIWYAFVVTTIVIASIVFGFLRIETPQEVREMKIDERQTQDLMNIQSHIEMYVYANKELPADIAISFDGLIIPEAPMGRNAYTYVVTGHDTYELCAQFMYPSRPGNMYRDVFYPDPISMKNNYNWEYAAGEWCFKRTVTQELEAKLR